MSKVISVPEHKTLASTPSNPDSGYSKIYSKSDNKWYRLDSEGNEVELGGGTGSSFLLEAGSNVTLLDEGDPMTGAFLPTENGTVTISATSLPSGLTWKGLYNPATTTYELNDVVYYIDGDSIYHTYWAWNTTIVGNYPAGTTMPVDELPTTAISNTYWAQLGIEGPKGDSVDHATFTSSTGTPSSTPNQAGETDTYTVYQDAGETVPLGTFTVYNGEDGSDGANGASGVVDFVTKISSYTITAADKGWVILMNNTTDAIITVPNALSAFTNGYQVVIIKVGAGKVTIQADTDPLATVVVNSANDMKILRAVNSAATLLKQNNDTWWMFGDLTNIE